MILAIAALLIQPQVAPQLFAAEKVARMQPVTSISMNVNATEEAARPTASVAADFSAQPVAESASAALPDAPVPVPAVNTPAPMAFIKPGKAMTVSVGELVAEGRRKQMIWRGLGIASHSAATFDAWSTRHAITTRGAQELNPMLKPFAGNASLYAAIQVGPALMDYAGRKMMYSRHTWVRRLWWVPQSASLVSSLFCGVHNLGVR